MVGIINIVIYVPCATYAMFPVLIVRSSKSVKGWMFEKLHKPMGNGAFGWYRHFFLLQIKGANERVVPLNFK